MPVRTNSHLNSAQFEALAERWRVAYNSADSSALMEMYESEADYISSHVKGLVANGRRLLATNFRSGVLMGGDILTLSGSSRIQISCNLATLLCRYEANNSGQRANGRSLLVIRKTGSGWRIVLHMTVV